MTATTLILPDDLRTELEEIAKRESRSEIDIVRDALRKYSHEQNEIDWPRYIGMVSDGSFDVAEDEAYLAERWDAAQHSLPTIFGSVADGSVNSSNYEEWLAQNWKPD